ncbi:MAG: hypothetical protein HOV81_11550 [Kofleriaceae bacterium]|nr:hypothetical protein [Kofleriaceae bacterium]
MAGEQARYVVRTPLSLWIANGLLAGLCLLVFAAMLMFDHVPALAVFLAVGLAGATIAFWTSMSAYRVGGTRNLIRIYADRIEVPSVSRRAPLVFPREGLSVTVRDVLVNYRLALMTVARVSRGKLIELSCSTQKRTLSTLVLDDRGDEPALLADLGRFLASQPAIGRAAHDAPPPRTEYDDILDRELANVE